MNIISFTGVNKIYGPGIHDGKNVDKECAWESLKNLIEEQFQSKISVVAWIHLGGNEINSSNLHTQKIWSKEYPEILELVVHNGKFMKDMFELYGLTTKGARELSQYTKPIYQVHYESKMDSVKFIDGPLEVVHDIFEFMIDDPMDEKLYTKIDQYIIPNNVVKKFLEEAQTLHTKTLAFLAGQKDGNIIKVTHLIIPTLHQLATYNKYNGKYFIKHVTLLKNKSML